jgi:uncharacterized protein (DUF885 family)
LKDLFDRNFTFMYKKMFITTAAVMIITTIQPNQRSNVTAPKAIGSKALFAHKNNADLYWQALGLVASGNKEAALKVVEAIRQDIPTVVAPTWQEDQPSNIDHFFNKLFMTIVLRDPQMLSELGLFESIGIRDHNAYLTDVSMEALVQNLEDAQENLRRLNQYRFEDLSHEQKISYKIFSWMLNHQVDGGKFILHDYKIHQMDGVLAALSALLTQYHDLKISEDAQNYVARLGKISQQFQQVAELLAAQQARGIVPPRFTVEKVITILKSLTPEQVDKNIFYTHLEEQTAKFKVPNRSLMLIEAQQVLREDVYPAYKMLQNF